MKKVVSGKIYNTASAELVADWWFGASARDFNHVQEQLYKTRNGNWFLVGEGGPLSKYAKACGSNEVSGSEELFPFSPEEAMAWLEEHDVADALEKHFARCLKEA